MTDSAELQGITISSAGWRSPGTGAKAILDAGLRTALIEVDGRRSGSGVLIGKDLILTAQHVVRSKSGAKGKPEIVAVFDYDESPLASPAETGTRVPVVEIVAESPPAPAELGSASTSAAADHLDFAVLRLISPAPPGTDTYGHATFRSFYELKAVEYDIRGAELVVVHHPLGAGQKMSEVKSPRWDMDRTRIRYDSNTLQGSSGGPIVDHDGNLVAIHHYFGNRRNQGVPISAIARLLRAGPHAGLFTAPEPSRAHAAAPAPSARPAAGYNPFEPLDEWSSAFGDEHRSQYRPTLWEFTRGEIQVPGQLLRDVTERLRSGWCLLLGRGTVGKTTLALFVGLQHNSTGGTAYYMDFGDGTFQDPAVLIDSMSALVDDSTLFVVDNVHVNERLAHQLYRHWQRHGAGSRLLLVGRTIYRTVKSGVEGAGLSRLAPDAVTLEVTDDDLLLTYQRLARIHGLGDAGPTVPATTLAAWQALFAGDRIAFALALTRHLESRDARRWLGSGAALAANDAISYVTEKYLDPYPDARPYLLHLATASTFELSLPEETVPPGVMNDLVAAGIVYVTTHGSAAYRRYTLAHLGLGHLIMEANRTADGIASLSALAVSSPAFGFALAWRLDRVGQRDEALRILRELSADPRHMAKALSGTQIAVSILRLVADRGVRTYEGMDNALTPIGVPGALLDSVPIHLGTAKRFLHFVKDRMPAYCQRLCEALAEPGRRADIADAVPNDLSNAVEFLTYVDRYHGDLAGVLAPLLADPERCARIADSVASHLGNAVRFLEYADKRHRAVAAAVVPLLRDPERAARIADALPKQLGSSVRFLAYLDGRPRGLTAVLAPLLADPERCARVADALAYDLGGAIRFITYADERLPAVASTIESLLRDPARCARIADAMPNNLGNATEFLVYAKERLPEVAAALTSLLGDPARCVRIADAMPRNLGNATEFLVYAADRLPHVTSALTPLLGDPVRCARIADAVPNNLGNATEFLVYADDCLPEVASALRSLLTDPVRCAAIAEAVPNNLGNATEVLVYADERLPELAAALTSLLGDPVRCARIAEAVPNNPGNAAAFLEFAHRKMPALAARLEAMLDEPVMARRIVDTSMVGFETMLPFMQFAYAQMPAVAERLTVELTDMRRRPALVELAQRHPRERGSLKRIVELADLHHEALVAPLWTLFEPGEPQAAT
ncbi:trypsin-like serine peptidase [Phytohabitans sp. LJ34]|uniref:trypsin-like serine peptidase n=1 Tax=Phytohabitans sp. LJ34 TaxID=3452217 RepID=UPI003F889B5D